MKYSYYKINIIDREKEETLCKYFNRENWDTMYTFGYVKLFGTE